MEWQWGGDSYVPYVALRMFWCNKKREGNYPPQGSNYPRDFWKREEINRNGNCSKHSSTKIHISHHDAPSAKPAPISALTPSYTAANPSIAVLTPPLFPPYYY
jgi:hypothetical protein